MNYSLIQSLPHHNMLPFCNSFLLGFIILRKYKMLGLLTPLDYPFQGFTVSSFLAE